MSLGGPTSLQVSSGGSTCSIANIIHHVEHSYSCLRPRRFWLRLETLAVGGRPFDPVGGNLVDPLLFNPTYQHIDF